MSNVSTATKSRSKKAVVRPSHKAAHQATHKSIHPAEPQSKSGAQPPRPAVGALAAGALVATPAIEAHRLATSGVPVGHFVKFLKTFHLIDRDVVLGAVGMSDRTLQRAVSSDRKLDVNVSDRAIRLSGVMAQATSALGSQEAAERWLLAPALGLAKLKPIDLLQTTGGTELVKDLLTRMEFGVYA